MMITSSPTPTSTTVIGSLCPNCGSVHLNVATRATVNYQVIFDTETQELVVIGESVSDTEWDETSAVSCPACEWQGTLFDCL